MAGLKLFLETDSLSRYQLIDFGYANMVKMQRVTA